MKIDKNYKVGEVVSTNIKTAHVFKKYGIDFCCGGGISIEKACEKKQLITDDLIVELMNVDNSILPSQNYRAWSLDLLVDYIVNTHHTYIKQAFQLLDDYTAKVSKVHGVHHPLLLEIEKLYHALKEELLLHMHKEEKVLFPYVRQMVHAFNSGMPRPLPQFGYIANPIRMMEHEHDIVGDICKEIASLTNNYTPPEWACNTLKAMYSKLNEFELDLHLHIHLENNILFPKAKEMENLATTM